MSEHVKVSDAGGVRAVVMTRPAKKNAITRAMYTAMAEAIVSAQTDPSVRVVLIGAEGSVFTAGNDLMDFMEHPPTGEESETPPVLAFLEAILVADKPLVAAVNGAAVGVGVTMLLHCDLVYAAETATFRVPFTDLGLVPEAGSSLLLPERVGRARAGEMFLLGETVSAKEALEGGIVSRVFPQARLSHEVDRRCDALAKKPPAAVRAAKRLTRGELGPVRARMSEELALFAERLQSDEFREAAAAFFEKRQPDFSRFS
jgi:enoyl-CoA hydratase/carnithine racemase